MRMLNLNGFLSSGEGNPFRLLLVHWANKEIGS